jgi:hypothetical protein
MGKNKTQWRQENIEPHFYLYPARAEDTGWRVIRLVPFSKGVQKVAAGIWKLVPDSNGNPWYFQIKANFRIDEELAEGEETACTITARESKQHAGLFGRSYTFGMSEAARISRPKRPDGHYPPPEDSIERAIRKVRQWPFPASRIDDGSGPPIYGDRARRAYPRPDKRANDE